MFDSLRNFFTKNVGLKIVALFLALGLWFYIVNELHRGNEDEQRFLRKVLPSEEMVAKKLTIKPIFTGKTHFGYSLDQKKVVLVPEYCIVVGARDMLGKIRFAYTMPIDLSGANKGFTKSVPLSPIAPGVFMEETLVQVTVPVDKAGQ